MIYYMYVAIDFKLHNKPNKQTSRVSENVLIFFSRLDCWAFKSYGLETQKKLYLMPGTIDVLWLKLTNTFWKCLIL